MSTPSLETDLARARELEVDELAAAIETIGFDCTDCGACCTSEGAEPHTATIFPEEVRELGEHADGEPAWRDLARPMPYGLADPDEAGSGGGETLEWALQTDGCGDCAFYDGSVDGGGCTAYAGRPLICETYPFSAILDGEAVGPQPTGGAVAQEGQIRAHECEGLGRPISTADARELAATVKQRAIRELEEAIALREGYAPATPTPEPGTVVVHDSEGPKTVDGQAYGEPTPAESGDERA